MPIRPRPPLSTNTSFRHTSHLVGLVVRAFASRAADLRSIPACPVDLFSGSIHAVGTSVATLPGAGHYRVSVGTGRPGVSMR